MLQGNYNKWDYFHQFVLPPNVISMRLEITVVIVLCLQHCMLLQLSAVKTSEGLGFNSEFTIQENYSPTSNFVIQIFFCNIIINLLI